MSEAAARPAGDAAGERAEDDAAGARPGDRDDALGRLREDALAVLRGWTAPEPGQEALRQRFLRHVQAVPGALHRGGDPVHLTASCLVLSADRTRVLLVHHRRARRWLQPGGHLEPTDAGLRAAAVREATEETGLAGLVVGPQPVHLDAHRLGAAFGRCRVHLDVRYAAVSPPGSAPTASAESHAVRWWPLDRLPESAFDDLTPMVDAALRSHQEGGLQGG